MTHALVAVVAVLVNSALPGTPPPHEVRSKDVVDLLSGLTAVYKSPPTVGFTLRAFLFQADGECPHDQSCQKDRLMVAVTTLDEYPEKRAFEVAITGAYRKLVILSVPKRETDTYSVALYSDPQDGTQKCAVYVIALSEMKAANKQCPGTK